MSVSLVCWAGCTGPTISCHCQEVRHQHLTTPPSPHLGLMEEDAEIVIPDTHTDTDARTENESTGDSEESHEEEFTEINRELLKEEEEVSREDDVDGDTLKCDRVEEIVDHDSPTLEEEQDLPTVPPAPAPSDSWWRCLLLLSLASAWLSSILYCYLYFTTTCTTVQLWCPSPSISFTAQACCSSLWLSLGSPVGLGNECSIDMSEMTAACPMYDCYTNKTDGSLNVNGCSYVPNTLFNVGACNIHDLCYITPGASKKECDDTFVDNILRIYCDNVNVVERLACTGRAQLAGAVVSAIHTFYDESEEVRAGCRRSLSYRTTGVALVVIVISTIVTIFMRTRSRDTESQQQPTILQDPSQERIEEITVTEDNSTPPSDVEDEEIENDEVEEDAEVCSLLCDDKEELMEIRRELVLTEDLEADGSQPSSTME